MPKRKTLKTKDGKPIKRPTAKELTKELAPVIEAIEGQIMDYGQRDRFGRPSVMTPQTIAKLELAFKQGCTNREASIFAGISESTLDLFLQKDPEWKAYCYELKDHPTLMARQTLVKAVKESPFFALQYLERKLPHEFGRRVRHTVDVPEELTDEEMAEIDKLIDENL